MGTGSLLPERCKAPVRKHRDTPVADEMQMSAGGEKILI
jgi:hypothetical protein